MVRVEHLDPFEVYRVSSPPVIMPESSNNRKKGQAYMLYAPTVESGMQYLSINPLISFRNLTKYFVEKRWTIQLYGQSQQIIKPNGDGECEALLIKYRKGALKNIDGVTSFLPNYSGNTLKNFNVLIETNYVFDTILNNPKDRRLLSKKMPSVISELKRISAIDYLGDYQKTVIIPMDLWFSSEDYANPEKALKPLTPNPMGVILGALCNPATLNALGRIILIDSKTIMVLDGAAIGSNPKASKDPNTFIRSLLIKFMKKAKQYRDGKVPSEDEVDEGDEVAAVSMKQATEKTKDEVTAEKMLDAMKIDPDRLGDDAKANAVQVAHDVRVKKEQKQATTQADTPVAENIPVDMQDEIDTDISDVKLSDKEVDVLLTAQMEGRSVESQKRNEMLKEKYKELKVGDTPLADLVHEEEVKAIPTIEVKARTVNPAMKNIKAQRFEETYQNSLMEHDLVTILMHFAGAKPAMYLNTDIKVEDISTHTDRIMRYSVKFEDENRKRHSFSIRLPKMYKDKYLYLNGQELVITHQKLPLPITKVQDDRCQLVTNYNKIFVYRHGTALSPRMTRLKKLLSSGTLKNVSVRKGNCSILNKAVLTTVEFDELGSLFTRIKIGNLNESTTFLFDVNDTGAIVDYRNKPEAVQALDGSNTRVEDNTLFPVAIDRHKNHEMSVYWLSATSNHVFDSTGADKGEFSEFIIATLIKYDPSLEKELSTISAGTKFMYSRTRIMSQDIPLILVMGAADPNGLIGALEKGHIKYQFSDKRPTVDKNVTGVIPFADGYLTFDRYPYENSLLMNGLTTFPSKEYNFYDMNTRDAYVEIFDLMCGQRTLADNLSAFYYMMIDPITKDVLEKMKMPTDFTTLLFFCNGVLADNSFQIDSNYENSRVRSTEIIMAHLYRELAVAWSNVRSGRTDTFSIPEDVVIKLLLTSKIIDPKSKLNISLELENDRNVKLKGPSGMNEDHSFTIEKRAFHPSMRGIVGTNSTPSGEVGINRHLTLNANIDDARGFITINKDEEYDGTELLTPGELLQPFGPESADIERLCMSISQSKHLVPVQSQCSCPVSYDMERVAPYLSNDFAFRSKQAGKIVEISDDLMIIQYDDGTFDDIDLSEHPAKNTDGGFYIMNQMSTNRKVGSRFEANEILAFDKKYINDFDFFGDPCANVGTLARVAFESNGSVFEDSGYITDAFAHRFATKITKQKRVILSKFANINHIAKIGQAVQSNDIILAFDDTEDEFSSQLLASITDQMADDDEIVATSAPIVSKYTGVIKDIVITYTVPPEEMSPSLRKVVETYSKDAKKREKVLSKYRDLRDANTFVKSSEMAVPDSQGKVGGVKVGDGVVIDFYIEYEDVAGNGDKGSITALKFTVCNVIPTELAAYTEFNPDRKIDVHVSSFGAFKRMVADVEKIGILSKVLVETKRMMKEKYHQRVKDELKKMK